MVSGRGADALFNDSDQQTSNMEVPSAKIVASAIAALMI